MNSSNFVMPERLSWVGAGFKNKGEMDEVLQVIENTSNLLEETWGTRIRSLVIKTKGHTCDAFYLIKEITIRLECIAWWADKGFSEYRTLQYLIGNKWRRGKPKTYSKIIKGLKKATACIMAHEYAHLVSADRYGRNFIRPHGIEFQMVYADMLDQVFPSFGAVDRLLKKKSEQVDIVMYKEGIG